MSLNPGELAYGVTYTYMTLAHPGPGFQRAPITCRLICLHPQDDTRLIMEAVHMDAPFNLFGCVREELTIQP